MPEESSLNMNEKNEFKNKSEVDKVQCMDNVNGLDNEADGLDSEVNGLDNEADGLDSEVKNGFDSEVNGSGSEADGLVVINGADQTIKIAECGKKEDMRDVLDLAMNMGRVLLQNGAEIFRVEETIEHVCRRFEIKDMDTFVMSNGIFITARDEQEEIYAKVKHIPLSGFHLGIVTEVNDLSREISAGRLKLAAAREKLAQAEKLPPKRGRHRVLAAGIGSGCFCYLLQANIWESLMAVIIGCLLYVFVIFAENHRLTKVIVNILGGAFITVMAIMAVQIPWPFPMRIDKIIIGSILPLVPGMAFVNSIRDIANSDFISGIVRILDALLVFVYIAIGVGFVLGGYRSM